MRRALSRARADGKLGQRGSTDLGVVLAIAFGALFAIVWVVVTMRNSCACEDRGGYYYCAYKSPCVCLAKGTVLP